MATSDKEVLTCKDCKKDWQRDVKRGRKPVRCPDCDSNNEDSLEELTCEDCNRSWHRQVKRGSKPKTCFVCDGLVEEDEEESLPVEENEDTETLSCKVCGEDWKRETKPGRKPTTCPDCQDNPKEKVKEDPPKKAEKKETSSDPSFHENKQIKRKEERLEKKSDKERSKFMGSNKPYVHGLCKVGTNSKLEPLPPSHDVCKMFEEWNIKAGLLCACEECNHPYTLEELTKRQK